MSSSSVPIEAAALSASTAPTGWIGDSSYLYKEQYWDGDSGEVKDILDKYYGLKNATPVWTRRPQYGGVLFIFEAERASTPGQKTYYVWNGLEHSVNLITAHGLDEIRATINKLGGKQGYLRDLKLTPLIPTN